MMNLAGRIDCDKYIDSELLRCRIPTLDVDRVAGEVAYAVVGKTKRFSFKRAWTYWVVEGMVPIDVAWKLYDDPVGRTDIRVAGDCTCPAPAGRYVRWYDSDNTRVLPVSEKNQCEEYLACDSETLRSVARKVLDENRFSDFPDRIADGYIDLYHIDTEIGLRVFMDAMRVEMLL